MNTMVGVPPENAFRGQNDAEREALLGSIARTSSSSDDNNNNESSRGGGLRKTTTFAMVAAVGALAFASIGAAVVVGGGNGHHTTIKARLGGGRAAAAVPTPNTFGVGEGTAALGNNNNAQKKSARYAKVGLLGAMDIHAWPEPVEEEQHAPLEEHPDEEEEIQAWI